jgi:hypothetical protein
MVAALLRFADELDIDANRVEIATVQNFNLAPSNAVYWWLHRRTSVDISDRNVVMVQVSMHPDDVAQYGEIVQSAFIQKFHRKNAPVLSALAKKGISIVIDDQHGIKENDWEDPFPPEICEALRAMSGQSENPSTSGGHAPRQDKTDKGGAFVPPETPLPSEPGFLYLQQASQATGHDYRRPPNEARLAVFAITLADVERAIRKAVRNNIITWEFREQVLRPELTYIVEVVDRFRDERSVQINGGTHTLTRISTSLDEAIIQLNSAAQLEQDPALPHDQRYWVDYLTRYLECANKLRDAWMRIGSVGSNLLPRQPY